MKDNILLPNLEGQECTGCCICSAVCPTKAINIELSKDGFYEPKVNDELCINCSFCKKCCYKYDQNILEDEKEQYLCYSAINKDDNELKSSTSGGVSIELMKKCIKNGYKVVGVTYDYEQDIAVTKITSEISELETFKGSKYFQSYTVSAFEEVIKDNSNQRYAIFGTPCQIYALSRYSEVRKNREKFLLVDIFCHGCPSINLWNKYLESKKKELKVDKFDKIEFRSKSYGWHEYSNTFYKNNNKYYSQRINDPFYELFFDKNIFNKACYECKVRSSFKYTDIRIGDFWGVHYDRNSTGVSGVVLVSNRGKDLFKSIKDNFTTEEYEFEEIVKAQSYKKVHKLNNALRNETLEMLSSDMKLDKIIKDYRSKYSVNKRIKIKGKNVLKMLPRNIYLNLKFIVHKVGK